MSRQSKSLILLALCIAVWPMSVRPSDRIEGQLLGGSLNSPIRLEVFSDFQCPSCRQFYLETIQPVLQEYSSKDKVCVIYHEFPLNQHPYARQAALYSEAASRLGREKMPQRMINSKMIQKDMTHVNRR